MFNLERLIERAVKYAPRESGVPRWSTIGRVFALGSTSAINLCRQFNVDPQKVVFMCPVCKRWHEGDSEFRDVCSDVCARECDEI